MLKHTSLAIFLIVLLGSCQQSGSTDEVKQSINKHLHGLNGQFGIAYKNLTTGEQILINEHALFHAASTVKVPIMVEVYRQIAEGKFSLKDSIEIKNEFKSIYDSSLFSITPDSEDDRYLYESIGKTRAINDLLKDMIVVNSDLATNNIIELLDAKNITQTLRSIGANDIEVVRGMEDTKAFEAGIFNKVTAYDLMLLFEKIDNEELINTESSLSMMDILLDQQNKIVIPESLPESVKVAHMAGWIEGVRHDSGIVYLKDGQKYILVMLSKNIDDDKKVINAMSEISKNIYQHVSGN